MKKLLTADEVADALSVDPSTVRSWARAGRFPSYRLGRVVRFDPDAVEAWISGQIVGTPTPAAPVRLARSERVNRVQAAVSRKLQASTRVAV